MRSTTAATIAIVVALSSAPAAAATTASEDYAGYGESLGECGVREVPWAACFEVPSGAAEVTVDADDRTDHPVAFWVVFRDESASRIDATFACSGATASIPSGTVDVDVIVQDPSQSLLRALPCPLTVPTTGTLTATFT